MSYLLRKLSLTFPRLSNLYRIISHQRDVDRTKPELTPLGFKLAGNPLMQRGDFEPDETKLIVSYFEQMEVFVDVGANIGFFSCLARAHGKECVVVEPHGENLDYLYANLNANGWNDLEIFPVGLAAQPGIGRLYGGGTGASLIKNWGGGSGAWSRPIPITTLDILVGNRFQGRKLFIKIDVEGAEYEVMRGAEHVLDLSPSPIWFIEICLTENLINESNPHFRDIFELFWAHGYEARAADIKRQLVNRSDIDRWVGNKARDFGSFNYLFEKIPSQ